MRVTSINFVETDARHAECQMTFDDGAVSLQCESLLPHELGPDQHRIAWLQDALRQLRRMPEYRSVTREADFGKVVLSAASAMRSRASDA